MSNPPASDLDDVMRLLGLLGDTYDCPEETNFLLSTINVPEVKRPVVIRRIYS